MFKNSKIILILILTLFLPSIASSFTFSEKSDVFTNKYFKRFVEGSVANYVGYGNELGSWQNWKVTGKATHNNIRCLIVRVDESDKDYFVLYLAEDSNKDIRCLKFYGFDHEEGNYNEDFSKFPVLLIPQNPYVGQSWKWVDGATVTVKSTDEYVPKMATGLGPYSNCLKIKWMLNDDVDYLIFSSSGLYLKNILNDDGQGGYVLESFSGNYQYRLKYDFSIYGGAKGQNHFVKIFFDPIDEAMVIEIRANHEENWDDIIEKGRFKVYVPYQVELDFSKVGLYVSNAITKKQIIEIPNPDYVSFYEAFKSRFSKNDLEETAAKTAKFVDQAMSLGFSAVGALGNGVGAIGLAKVTWESLSNWLDEYYHNSMWIGDRNGIYPQFILTEKRSTGEYWGNCGRVIEFAWETPDVLFGLVDSGYQVVVLKLPVTTWGDSIPIFGEIKIHDAFDTPWITLFSKKLRPGDAK